MSRFNFNALFLLVVLLSMVAGALLWVIVTDQKPLDAAVSNLENANQSANAALEAFKKTELERGEP